MNYSYIRCMFVAIILALSGCASLQLEKPHVALVNFTPRPLDGLEAQIDIVLRITNPNAMALPLAGMNYQIALNGEPFLSGVSNNLPTIKAYGEETVAVTVSTSLLSTSKIILKLLNSANKDIRYQFKSTLDLKGMLPSFNIVEEGLLPINRP